MSIFRKLPPIVPVVDSSEDTVYRARLIQNSTREVLSNPAIQQMAQKIVDLQLQLRDLRNLVEPLVQEFECAFDNDEKCTSEKIAQDYIALATFLRDKFGRKDERRIEHVQAWLDSPDSLPFK